MTRKERRLKKYVLKYFPDFYIHQEALVKALFKAKKSLEIVIEKNSISITYFKDYLRFAPWDESEEAQNAKLSSDLADAIVEAYKKQADKDFQEYKELQKYFNFRYPFAVNGRFTLNEVKKFVKGA